MTVYRTVTQELYYNSPRLKSSTIALMIRFGFTLLALKRPTREDRHSAGSSSLGTNPRKGLPDDVMPIKTLKQNQGPKLTVALTSDPNQWS